MIALDVGFADRSRFTKAFRWLAGVTPGTGVNLAAHQHVFLGWEPE